MTIPAVRRVAAAVVLGVTAALLSALPAPTTAAPPEKKGEVVWDSTAFVAGTGVVAAHGKVPGRKKKVLLQVELPGRWQTFGKAKSDGKGRFAVTGRLDWYGAHKVRVATTGRQAFRRSTTVTVSPSYVPRGNPADHAFLTGERGLRYSYDPCTTVRYVVNADDVGPAGIAMVQQAMTQLSYATGIKTKYVGTSHQIPFTSERTRLPKRQDLLVAWASQAEVPDFVTQNKIGFGGPAWVYRARDGKGRKVLMTDEGAVVLNTDAYNSGVYTQGFAGTTPTWGELVLHELGHAFGLDHVLATDEIMYPNAGAGPYPDGTFIAQYDAGDLAGLAAGGLDQGCLRKVRSFRQEPTRVAVPAPVP